MKTVIGYFGMILQIRVSSTYDHRAPNHRCTMDGPPCPPHMATNERGAISTVTTFTKSVFASSGIGLLVVGGMYVAQLNKFTIVKNGGVNEHLLSTLFKAWIFNGSTIPSGNNNVTIETETHEPSKKEVPTQLKKTLICLGSNRLAVGLVNEEKTYRDGKLKCKYSGSPVIIIRFRTLALLLLVPVLACMLAMARRKMIERRRAKQCACRKCGYSLVGSINNICPECGTTFEAVQTNNGGF